MSGPAPNVEPPSPALKRIGEVISGRYQLKEVLGEGGMGAVYLAEHTHMRKRVALKVLHAEMIENVEVLARFEREAVAAAHIEHPNVAAATDFGRTDDGGFFLVLEYLEGKSLREVLRGGAMAPARVLHIARQIALALERAHDAGIVHRDLKPENVMLVHKGDDPDFVKVLDFGIAKVAPEVHREGAASQPLTKMGTVLGTPEYMAPEQALGEAVTPQADLYALGVMLYEMLCGKHCFDPPDRLAMLSFHIVAPVPMMRDRAPELDVPLAIETIVRKLLEKDAKERYASSRELVGAIDAAASMSGIVLAASPHSSPRDGFLMTPPPASIQIAPPSANRLSIANGNEAYAQTSLGLEAPQSLGPSPAMSRRGPSSSSAEPSPLQRFLALPKGAQIGIAAAVPLTFVLFVTLIVVAIRGPKSDGKDGADGGTGASSGVVAQEKPKNASADKLKTAEALGPEALESLAKEYPEDAAITQKLVTAYHARGAENDAVRIARELAKRDATKASASEVVTAVASIAQQGGRGDADELAYALLENDLGEAGVDAILDIATKGPAPSRNRAIKSLAKPEVRAHASKAAAIWIDMNGAKGCAKKDLMERAKDEGDTRLLTQLKPLKATRGCGFLGSRDCYPCLHRDTSLDDAIQAIEGRAK